jgi:hypothetical protein
MPSSSPSARSAARLGFSEPLRAADVLDLPRSEWSERPWFLRRDAGPDDQPFCDIAASQVLARLAEIGGPGPVEQEFLSAPGGLVAWRGEFASSVAWCASRGDQFWAWASGDGTADARMEISGALGLWDADFIDCFARSVGEVSSKAEDDAAKAERERAKAELQEREASGR